MGSIRKVTKVVKGKEYTYYEARYTEGFDPGTGKQIQRSITDKSKKVVAQKLKDALYSLDRGDYTAPCKMTVGEWLDKWAEDYLGSVKPATVCAYKATIKTHLKPGLGAVKLSVLDTPIIQNFYNNLISPQKNKKPASPKLLRISTVCSTRLYSRLFRMGIYNGCLCSSPRGEEADQAAG